MVKVRLFAQAADVVDESMIEVDADSIDGVRGCLSDQYGQKMIAVLNISQIWLNGKPSDSSSQLKASDEVAIIPPVSGG